MNDTFNNVGKSDAIIVNPLIHHHCAATKLLPIYDHQIYRRLSMRQVLVLQQQHTGGWSKGPHNCAK
jgi:hypothetical protein